MRQKRVKANQGCIIKVAANGSRAQFCLREVYRIPPKLFILMLVHGLSYTFYIILFALLHCVCRQVGPREGFREDPQADKEERSALKDSVIVQGTICHNSVLNDLNLGKSVVFEPSSMTFFHSAFSRMSSPILTTAEGFSWTEKLQKG